VLGTYRHSLGAADKRSEYLASLRGFRAQREAEAIEADQADDEIGAAGDDRLMRGRGLIGSRASRRPRLGQNRALAKSSTCDGSIPTSFRSSVSTPEARINAPDPCRGAKARAHPISPAGSARSALRSHCRWACRFEAGIGNFVVVVAITRNRQARGRGRTERSSYRRLP